MTVVVILVFVCVGGLVLALLMVFVGVSVFVSVVVFVGVGVFVGAAWCAVVAGLDLGVEARTGAGASSVASMLIDVPLMWPSELLGVYLVLVIIIDIIIN